MNYFFIFIENGFISTFNLFLMFYFSYERSFDVVTFLNGISTLVGFLMRHSLLEKGSSDIIYSMTGSAPPSAHFIVCHAILDCLSSTEHDWSSKSFIMI